MTGPVYFPTTHDKSWYMDTRYATSKDIPELVRVINVAYRVEDFFIDGNRTNAADVTSRMEIAGSCFIVIDSDNSDTLAAAVFVDIHDRHGHFAVLSVDPAFQGRGLARILIDAVENHCRDAGCNTLDIEVVNLRLELPAFYTKFGFTRTGTAIFPNTEKLTRDAHLILMSKPL